MFKIDHEMKNSFNSNLQGSLSNNLCRNVCKFLSQLKWFMYNSFLLFKSKALNLSLVRFCNKNQRMLAIHQQVNRYQFNSLRNLTKI